MALYHRATLTPSKLDAVAAWIPTRPWGPSAGEQVGAIGAFRFDDPGGRVGMEVHLVTADGVIFLVPLTYRDAPLDGADDEALVTEMEHSALGTRWVYDGLRDPLFVTMLAAVAMTGQGEALGMLESDGRWVIAPTNVRIRGGGWGLDRVAVDGFVSHDADAASPTFGNDRFELTIHRRPRPGVQPAIGLTAAWADGPGDLVVAEVVER
jgi:hypothetical protein